MRCPAGKMELRPLVRWMKKQGSGQIYITTLNTRATWGVCMSLSGSFHGRGSLKTRWKIGVNPTKKMTGKPSESSMQKSTNYRLPVELRGGGGPLGGWHHRFNHAIVELNPSRWRRRRRFQTRDSTTIPTWGRDRDIPEKWGRGRVDGGGSQQMNKSINLHFLQPTDSTGWLTGVLGGIGGVWKKQPDNVPF